MSAPHTHPRRRRRQPGPKRAPDVVSGIGAALLSDMGPLQAVASSQRCGTGCWTTTTGPVGGAARWAGPPLGARLD